MRFRIILRVLLVASLAGATFGFIAIPSHGDATTQAGPICASASATTIAGDYSAGPVCVPYSGSVLCHSVTVYGGVLATVRASGCHPW